MIHVSVERVRWRTIIVCAYRTAHDGDNQVKHINTETQLCGGVGSTQIKALTRDIYSNQEVGPGHPQDASHHRSCEEEFGALMEKPLCY